MGSRLAAAVFSIAMAATLVPLLPFEASAAPRPTVDRRYATDRAIVGYSRPERADAAETIEGHGADIVGYNRAAGYAVVETPLDSRDWADGIESADHITYAEPDWQLTGADLTPTDPSWNALWGMKKVQAPAAWQASTGSRDVVVAVIDSGIDYTHEDLAAQMWVNPDEDPSTPGDDDNNGWRNDVHGIDCANDDADPVDDTGHGTHVAGTIGAAANNRAGVAGSAWNVKLMALKFLGADGVGYTSDAIQCLYYAIDEGAHITNNSWGGANFSRTLHDAISYAGERDQLFVAAAGNDGVDADVKAHYPSAYDLENVVSVAASTSDDQLAGFSNYGTRSVDLAAPGVKILSTVPGGYAYYSGTSMATPHVTGAAVLALAMDPALRSDVTALRAALLENVDPVAGLAGKVATGGRLNIARTVRPDRPTVMHVDHVEMSARKVNTKLWKATLKVAMATESETAVEGARVVVEWSDGHRASCATGVAGACSVSLRLSRASVRSIKATVASVAHAELSHDPAQDLGLTVLVARAV